MARSGLCSADGPVARKRATSFSRSVRCAHNLCQNRNSPDSIWGCCDGTAVQSATETGSFTCALARSNKADARVEVAGSGSGQRSGIVSSFCSRNAFSASNRVCRCFASACFCPCSCNFRHARVLFCSAFFSACSCAVSACPACSASRRINSA